MPYTHQKRPYRAEVIEWLATNLDEVRTMLDDVTLYGSDQLIVRWQDTLSHKCGITTLKIGDMIVRGENGVVRTYPRAVFDVKYKKIDS